jgi:hypothetical protein
MDDLRRHMASAEDRPGATTHTCKECRSKFARAADSQDETCFYCQAELTELARRFARHRHEE